MSIDVFKGSSVEKEGAPEYKVGDWYWVKESGGGVNLAIISELKSNIIVLMASESRNSKSVYRVFYQDAHERLKYEANGLPIVDDKVSSLLASMQNLQLEMQTKTSEVIMGTPMGATAASGKEVALGGMDIEKYKQSLIEYQQKTLVAMMEGVEQINKDLEKWMGYRKLSLELSLGQEKACVARIEDQITNVSLYAGIGEDLVVVIDGEPAPSSEKLRVFQSLMYMDEQCLIGYEAGGMDIGRISDFDEWLSKSDNLNRVLPYPKCAVAFRVRREAKNYGRDSVYDLLKNITMANHNNSTFLYVRNGQMLSRLEFDDFDFGETLFPSLPDLMKEEMMVQVFAGKVDARSDRTFITKREYDDKMREINAARAVVDAWCEANPYEEWLKENPDGYSQLWMSQCPHRDEMNKMSFSGLQDYCPVNNTSVYFDDAIKVLQDGTKQFNRVALIFQGLLDRSTGLAPFPKVVLTNKMDFERHVELINEEMTLTHGDAPDLRAYLVKANEISVEGDTFTGMREIWVARERAKQLDRKAMSGNFRDSIYIDCSKAPPRFLKATKVTKKYVSFEWQVSQDWESRTRTLRMRVSLLDDMILNVENYKSGDFKPFLQDTRTRREYLKWAPLLLAAEDYVAGL